MRRPRIPPRTRRASSTRRWLIPLSAVAAGGAWLLFADDALARPGGGHSYGGGGYSSSGGGGGDGDALFLLLHLAIRYPQIGVPALALYVGFMIYRKRAQKGDHFSSSVHHPAPTPRRYHPRSADLSRLRSIDPDFSVAVFEDFAFRLYAAAHERRHDEKELAELTPYLDEQVRKELASRPPVGAPVTKVVVGSMQVQAVRLPHGEVSASEVVLRFEANLTTEEQGQARTWYLSESWHLHREAGVTTRPPEDVRSLTCPSCGAPFASTDGATCEYCGQQSGDGRYDWSVSRAVVLERRGVPPRLGEHVAERGTDLPTIYGPAHVERFEELLASDPGLTRDRFRQRLEMLFTELYDAWSKNDLDAIRPWVSEGLHDYLRYWVEAYLEQGRRNIVDDAQFHRWEVAKVERDKWYDAITVRVFASGKDYTVEKESGRLVSGDQSQDRHFSEYWTLIRAAQSQGAPRLDHGCPNCGAPLQVSMTGQCTHCDAHVTSGEFDWVLSKIEQDEAYTG